MEEKLQKQLAYLAISSTRHVGYFFLTFFSLLLGALGSWIGAVLFLAAGWLLIQDFTLKQRKRNAISTLLSDDGEKTMVLINMGVKFSDVKKELKQAIIEEGKDPLDSKTRETVVKKLMEEAIIRELKKPINSLKAPFVF